MISQNTSSRDFVSGPPTDTAADLDITVVFRAARKSDRRPFDPIDPGPFGSPGWSPDRRTGRHRRSELPDPLPDPRPKPASASASALDEPYRFSRMRELAWERFLAKSEPLAAAHMKKVDQSAFERGCGPTIARFVRLVKWIGSVVKQRKRGADRSQPPARPQPKPVPKTSARPVAARPTPKPKPTPTLVAHS